MFDNGCAFEICTNMQGLTRSRKLAKRKVEIRVANAAKVSAARVGTYSLLLPLGLILVLQYMLLCSIY